jgi:hypothetical protein
VLGPIQDCDALFEGDMGLIGIKIGAEFGNIGHDSILGKGSFGSWNQYTNKQRKEQGKTVSWL